MKILSVDDSKSIRKIVQDMVEVIGLDLQQAENGVLALEKLEENNGDFDLIILDWEMPEMNGYEFLKTVKDDERYKSIPIIMLTSISQKEKIIEAIRAGAKQYITKPFTGEELMAKIVQTLGLDSLEEL